MLFRSPSGLLGFAGLAESMLPVILRVTVDDHSTVLSMMVSRDGTAILKTWADDVDEIAW